MKTLKLEIQNGRTCLSDVDLINVCVAAVLPTAKPESPLFDPRIAPVDLINSSSKDESVIMLQNAFAACLYYACKEATYADCAKWISRCHTEYHFEVMAESFTGLVMGKGKSRRIVKDAISTYRRLYRVYGIKLIDDSMIEEVV